MLGNSKTDNCGRTPIPGQRGHGDRIIHLMCLKENYNISKKCSGDIITVLPGDEKKGTKDIKIRVIEVILDNGTKEYLATNPFDLTITQSMFQELYFYR